jgi:hypothetical protein
LDFSPANRIYIAFSQDSPKQPSGKANGYFLKIHRLHCTLDFLAAEERVSRDVKSPAKRGWFRPIGEQVNNTSLAEVARHSRLLRQMGCYERNEVKPSNEMVAASIAETLEVSLDYLVGNIDLLLEKNVVNKIVDIQKLNSEDRAHVFALLDAFLQSQKAKKVLHHKTKAH